MRKLPKVLLVVLATAGAGFASFLGAQVLSDTSESRASADIAGSAAPEQQRAALADGLVTASEYEDAALRFYACLSAGGFEPVEPLKKDRFGLYNTVLRRSAVAPDGSPRSSQDAAACQREEMDAIQFAYVQSARPTAADYGEGIERMTACLSEKGLIAPGRSGPEVVRAAVEESIVAYTEHGSQVRECLGQVQKEMNWPGYTP